MIHKEYPTFELYLAKNADGEPVWHPYDPLLPENRKISIDDLERMLTTQFGNASYNNPLRIEFSISRVRRPLDFTIRPVNEMLQGRSGLIAVDYDGNRVKLLDARNADPMYPFNGAVTSPKGDFIENRTYTLTGACSDGNGNHDLLLLNPADGGAVLEYVDRETED